MKNIFFALYDEKDFIIGVFENYYELAAYFEKPRTDVIRNAVNRNHKIRKGDQWFRIYKIDERQHR